MLPKPVAVASPLPPNPTNVGGSRLSTLLIIALPSARITPNRLICYLLRGIVFAAEAMAKRWVAAIAVNGFEKKYPWPSSQ